MTWMSDHEAQARRAERRELRKREPVQPHKGCQCDDCVLKATATLADDHYRTTS